MRLSIVSILVVLFAFSSNLMAEPVEHVVKMLNVLKIKGEDGKEKKVKNVFEPDFLKVKVGDTIKFVPTKKGHSVQSFKKKESRPEGASKFKGKLNKETIVKVEKEGAYFYQCKPHFAMGMIGMFVAGEASNIESIKEFASKKFKSGKKKKRYDSIMEKYNKSLEEEKSKK